MDWKEKYLNKVTCGDCLELMREIPDKSVDLVLTDPPYGLNNKIHDGGTWATHEKYNDTLVWDYRIKNEHFMTMKSISINQIIWGGNYYTDMLPISRCWLGWVKPHFPTMSELDMAWTSFDKPAKVFSCPRVNPSIHPTQKPIKLIEWIIKNYTTETDVILDPFLGSGTTALACERLNRQWIGFEISEKYCEIARKRIEQERAQIKLF